jgi:hypothetical protein
MTRTCPKGHPTQFPRSCPQCAAQARPLKSVATRAQEVLDSAKQARQARRYKKALAGIALAQKQRRAMDAWEVGMFQGGLS